jgi:plasmid stabilization system protein ParE
VAFRIVIRLLAAEQLADASAWYRAQGGEPLANRFEAAVESAFDKLREFPRVGTPEPDAAPLMGEVRSIPVGGGFSVFLIYYQTHPDVVEVLALWHAARDSDALKRLL